MVSKALKEYMSEDELAFWSQAEKHFHRLDPLICVLLSSNGYSTLYAFKEQVTTDESFINSIVDTIKVLSQESKFYKAVEFFAHTKVADFKLRPGHIASIKQTIKKLSEINEEEFFPSSTAEPENEHENVQATTSRKRSKGRNPGKFSETLSDDVDYVDEIISQLKIWMEIADPDLILNLPTRVKTKTDKKVVVVIGCPYCPYQMETSAYQSAGYTRYSTSNFKRHIMSKHESAAERVRNFMEKAEIIYGQCEDEEENVTSSESIIEKIRPFLRSDGRFKSEMEFLINLKLNDYKSENPFTQYQHLSEMMNKRGNKGNRYDNHLEPFKQFCTYMYLKSGNAAYQALAMNSAMPSSKTCKNVITDRNRMEFGTLYLDGIIDDIKDLNAELDEEKKCSTVIIQEDATRISDFISYDPTTDEIFGLVPEYDLVVGLPRKKFFAASSPSKVLKDLKNFKIAPYIQIIIAKPLVLGSRTRVIGIFPTDNKYNSTIVNARWKFITEEFKKRKLTCIFCTDADPRLFGAMKTILKFGRSYSIPGLCIPLLIDVFSTIKTVTDSYHFLNNNKNRMNDSTNSMMFGDFYVSMNFLKILINLPDVSRVDHLLNKEDVGTFDSSKDKMNSKSTVKICEPHVIELLKKVPGSYGTRIYLQMMRDYFDAFIEVKTDDKERIKKAFRVLCLIRIWRNNVKTGERSSFITNVNWACLEMNVGILYKLIREGNGRLIVICNSQGCEEFFRVLRSMTTFLLTQINFSTLEVLEKINRIEKIIEITMKYKEYFKFPEIEKLKSDLKYFSEFETVRLELEDCHRIIQESLTEAKEICKKAGMKNLEPCNPENYFKKFSDEEFFETTIDDHLRETYGNDYFEEDEELENNQLNNVEITTLENGKRILKIKHKFFIDEITEGAFFKQCNEDGEEIKLVNKSEYIWDLIEEKHRVSSDRLQRFKKGKKEIVVERVISSERFYKDTALLLGDYVIFRICETNDLCVIGQVLNFEFRALNTNVLVRISPLYRISMRGVMYKHSKPLFTIAEYVASTKKEFFDFENLTLSRNLFKELKLLFFRK